MRSPRPGSRRCGSGPASTSGSSATANPAATVIAEPYELARFICFRRTADQVRRYRWDGDPEPYVALFTDDGPAEPLPT